MNKSKSNLGIAIILCATLGLAPFVPEPHIWGKLKWIAGGAQGMQAMDYFDLLLHGFPWIFLLFELSKVIRRMINR